MSHFSGTEISAFKSAYQLLIRTAKRSVITINQDPKNIAIFCQILSDALENVNRRIHIVGIGRSGKVGMILGECLKNIGFNSRVSYLGKNHAQSVRKDDVVIAVTGSGWTKFTTAALEYSIRKKGKILTFTGVSDSKAAKLSEVIIQSPLGFQPQDHIYPFVDIQDPLSPLGTIFELTTMVIGIGVINGVFKGSCTKGFDEATTDILRIAEKSLDDLKRSPELYNYIRSLSDYCDKTQAKVFFYGNGLNKIISTMSSIRFRSLGMNVHSMSDWRFRRKGDLLIVLSGSGVSASTLNLVKSAKSSQMTVLGITSFPQSKLAEKADNFMVLRGRKEETTPDGFQLLKPEIYLPTFEYTASVSLEACVAQIAMDLEKSEDTG
ncbi:MAG: SIS domain-containing protein [Candidatus Hodarchaeales archaeon]|jgi:6-phospho-3-hexuloisomerase